MTSCWSNTKAAWAAGAPRTNAPATGPAVESCLPPANSSPGIGPANPSRPNRTRGSPDMMKLYSGDLSPYSARVRMQIYAKGIGDITLERPASFGTPKFREDNPIGRIPVLDIDGDLMPESEVISEYLEEVYPEPSMLGATPRETAHIRTVARVGDIYIMNNMFMLSP